MLRQLRQGSFEVEHLEALGRVVRKKEQASLAALPMHVRGDKLTNPMCQLQAQLKKNDAQGTKAKSAPDQVPDFLRVLRT